MGISTICCKLFENMIESYKNSSDESRTQICSKLLAIRKEIKANPEIYSDESLIARLSSSAVILQSNNPQFLDCLKTFLITYEKKVHSLDILAEYQDSTDKEDFSHEDREQSVKETSTSTTSPFFRELEAAIKARAARMDPNRSNSSFQI
ncbi:hypothetical protein [Legionella brunensis]|uniref:Uncharacterized protein n=1 Tax=Legionella brunensis TaxID=29422 RepID=A0A0W0STK4_9GAMM|nr:hypothetical protein [Legionella brunensis]KTC86611.1 hypothetical protein Lbru_0552 [Legionella brunensis]